jgi:methanol metabolism-related c-type cytochrome
MILAAVIVAAGAYLVSSEAVVPEKAKEMAANAKATTADAVTKAKDMAAKSTEAVKSAATGMATKAKDATAKMADKVTEKAAEAKKMVVAAADTEESDAPKAVGNNSEGKEWEDGKWVDGDGSPTYNIDGDGQVIKKVDWHTYSGWRRYHAECHVCHGPSGKGSTYAPALAETMKNISYEKFLQVVSSGQQNVWGRDNSIMPALGDNKNVMCYIDDIYIYLRARAEGAMPAGKLGAGQRAAKPQEAKEFENECFDG